MIFLVDLDFRKRLGNIHNVIGITRGFLSLVHVCLIRPAILLTLDSARETVCVISFFGRFALVTTTKARGVGSLPLLIGLWSD